MDSAVSARRPTWLPGSGGNGRSILLVFKQDSSSSENMARCLGANAGGDLWSQEVFTERQGVLAHRLLIGCISS